MRKADQPGTYRIRNINGEVKLAGVKRDGRRVRLSFSSESEAREAARTLFPSHYAAPPPPPVIDADDWGMPSSIPGLPSVGRDTAQAVAAAMGIDSSAPGPDSAPLPDSAPEEPPEKEKKRQADMARAKSLCEFFGVGWAVGDAWASKKLAASLGKKPVNVSSKQVTDLGKAATTAFETLLGDWELGPWTMMLLLTVAMPISVIIQSPALPPVPKDTPAPPPTRQRPSSSDNSESYSEPTKLRVVDLPDPSNKTG